MKLPSLRTLITQNRQTIPTCVTQRPQVIAGYLSYCLSKQSLKQQLTHGLKKDRSMNE